MNGGSGRNWRTQEVDLIKIHFIKFSKTTKTNFNFFKIRDALNLKHRYVKSIEKAIGLERWLSG